MPSRYLCVIFIAALFAEIAFCQVTVRKNPLLSRKKRYLAFPEGSNFVISFAGIKNFLRKPTPGVEWKWLVEMDVPFPLPSEPSFFKDKKKKFRQRREIYTRLENAFDENGLNGKSCVNRIICESRQFLQTETSGNSLIKSVLTTIFDHPDVDNYEDFCNNTNYSDCTVPFLDYILAALGVKF